MGPLLIKPHGTERSLLLGSTQSVLTQPGGLKASGLPRGFHEQWQGLSSQVSVITQISS